MAKTWVLDTDTKGTGAQMLPLEKVQGDPARRRRPGAASSERARHAPQAPEPRRPPRFKVVDVMTGRVLVEGADTRATVELLEGVRSVVDVTVHVWDPGEDEWRQLSHGARKKIWALRGRRPPARS